MTDEERERVALEAAGRAIERTVCFQHACDLCESCVRYVKTMAEAAVRVAEQGADFTARRTGSE